METITLVDPRGLEWSVEVARSAWARMRGLLGKSDLSERAGMLFERCRSVHTIGMRFGLDVVFLDAAYRVIDVRAAPPGRWSVRCAGARHVLEVAIGSGLRTGDVLQRP
jgi:uncharacterized membrane protein (UPF0127 family)